MERKEKISKIKLAVTSRLCYNGGMNYILKIGNRVKIECDNLTAAKRMWESYRTEHDIASSTMPSVTVNGLKMSYNGKLWDKQGKEVLL